MELRDKIDHVLTEYSWGQFESLEAATNAILAIPEIRDALDDAEKNYENGYSAGYAAAVAEA